MFRVFLSPPPALSGLLGSLFPAFKKWLHTAPCCWLVNFYSEQFLCVRAGSDFPANLALFWFNTRQAGKLGVPQFVLLAKSRILAFLLALSLWFSRVWPLRKPNSSHRNHSFHLCVETCPLKEMFFENYNVDTMYHKVGWKRRHFEDKGGDEFIKLFNIHTTKTSVSTR